MDPKPEHLVFALTSATGASKACATHGDEATVAVLRAWYAQLASAADGAGGTLVKLLGDGALLTFPVSRVRDAMPALRALQASGTALWSRFDARCRVQVKVGAGVLMTGMFGAPGREQYDVYGHALNELFKKPWNDFEVMPTVTELL
jgi:class 3 adenylate cyclase